MAPGNRQTDRHANEHSTALCERQCGRTALYDGIVAGGAVNEFIMYALLHGGVRTLVCIQQQVLMTSRPCKSVSQPWRLSRRWQP